MPVTSKKDKTSVKKIVKTTAALKPKLASPKVASPKKGSVTAKKTHQPEIKEKKSKTDKPASKTSMPSADKAVVKVAASKKQDVKNKTSSVKSGAASAGSLSTLATEVFGVKPYTLLESEDYMSEAQQAHFRELLHAWRATLAMKIDDAVSHLKEEPKHFADLNDRATQEEEFNLELKARDREADLVADIDEALKRLNEGDYGYCEDCGIEIGIRRLEARPTATSCIDCKTLAEMRQRQVGGV